MLCDDLDGWDGGGWEGGFRGRGLCIHTTDILHFTAETDTTV